MALPAAGIGVFAYPHPLHNVFGLSELIGYQAPLILSLTWRRDPQATTLVAFSWIMFEVNMGHYRSKPERFRSARTGLGLRKACLWPRSEGTIRRLVFLVRRGGGAVVSAQVPGGICLYKSCAREGFQGLLTTCGAGVVNPATAVSIQFDACSRMR